MKTFCMSILLTAATNDSYLNEKPTVKQVASNYLFYIVIGLAVLLVAAYIGYLMSKKKNDRIRMAMFWKARVSIKALSIILSSAAMWFYGGFTQGPALFLSQFLAMSVLIVYQVFFDRIQKS